MCRHCADKDSLITSLKQANNEQALVIAHEMSRQDAVAGFVESVAEGVMDTRTLDHWMEGDGWDLLPKQ